MGSDLAMAAPGEGREGHRRGDVREDAEVEGEHVGAEDDRRRSPGGKAIARLQVVEDHDDGRGGDGRGDDVVGRRRHAHAEDEGGDHREDEGEEEVAAGRRHEDLAELEAQAGLGDHADDDAGAGAGRDDAEGAPGARPRGPSRCP